MKRINELSSERIRMEGAEIMQQTEKPVTEGKSSITGMSITTFALLGAGIFATIWTILV